MKKKTSPVWNYFEDVDVSNAKCNVCDRVYSRKGRTTTALKSHLKAKHAEVYAEFQKLDDAAKLSLEMETTTKQEQHDCDTEQSPERVKKIKVELEESDPPAINEAEYLELDEDPLNEQRKSSTSTPKHLLPGTSSFNLSEYELVGMNVAKKLAKMSPIQAMYAESVINNVLRRGLENKLKEASDVCDGVCRVGR